MRLFSIAAWDSWTDDIGLTWMFLSMRIIAGHVGYVHIFKPHEWVKSRCVGSTIWTTRGKQKWPITQPRHLKPCFMITSSSSLYRCKFGELLFEMNITRIIDHLIFYSTGFGIGKRFDELGLLRYRRPIWRRSAKHNTGLTWGNHVHK
jgi:hypothetical protein